jgi:hypothetical protein
MKYKVKSSLAVFVKTTSASQPSWIVTVFIDMQFVVQVLETSVNRPHFFIRIWCIIQFTANSLFKNRYLKNLAIFIIVLHMKFHLLSYYYPELILHHNYVHLFLKTENLVAFNIICQTRFFKLLTEIQIPNISLL